MSALQGMQKGRSSRIFRRLDRTTRVIKFYWVVMDARSELNPGKQFGEVADIYDQFRTDYPREIFLRILSAVAPPHNRLVDLGVGTGKMARGFIGEFDEIVGVEPDVAMAGKLGKLEPRIQARIATAEEVVFPAASVDLVTVATALHWMDATAVLSRVTEWLRPGGIFAICGGGFCSPEGSVGEVVKREFEERWNAYRDPRSKKHFPEEVLRSEPRMPVLEVTTIHDLRTLTATQYTGYCRSTSFGNAYARSLKDAEGYWRELESRFRAAQPDDNIEVDFERFLMLLKKA
jgi:ubiquinone/menaquinone biosynthesis C-methylase UbiE